MNNPSTTITVLFENHCSNEALHEGWGFSLFIERGDRCILFDTGLDPDALMHNVQALGVDLSRVTDVVLSHKHLDHIAGCEVVFPQLKQGTSVHFPRTILPFFSKKHPHLNYQLIKDRVEIFPGARLYPMRVPRSVLYEQALVMDTTEGVALITGCSHPGIVEIIEEVREQEQAEVALVLGGFHLFMKPYQEVFSTVERFQQLGVKKVAPCHCSGDHTIRLFQQAYKEKSMKVGTGAQLQLA